MFCKYCGNELSENAVVCTKCGCLAGKIKPLQTEQNVVQPALQVMAATQPQPSRKYFRLAKIFSIVAMAVSGIALLCAMWFFGLLWLAFAVGEGGGMILAIYSVFGLFGMIGVSPFALTTGILAFVFKHKSEAPTGGFPIAAFVLGICSFAIGWGTYLLLILQ